MGIELELKDEKGLLGTITLTDEKIAELKEALGSGSASVAEASAEVQAELKQTAEENAELKEKVANLESEEHRKAVLSEWLQGMTPLIYLELGGKLGYQVEFVKATEAEVAEAERKEKEEAEEKEPGFLGPFVAAFSKKGK